MIVLSRDLRLALLQAAGADNPVIGWHNLVTSANVSADQEQEAYPASNLANPSSVLLWKAASAATQYVSVAVNSALEIDYLAVARHNFGSAAIAVRIEGDSGAGFETLVDEAMLADDGPALFRWEPRSLVAVRARLAAGSAPPQAAVLYAGKLLVLQRRLYGGHTPIAYGRKTNAVNGMSEAGDFLGRIVLGGSLETAVSLQNIAPDWYRSQFDPFVQAARESPFFFAWRPGSYPREVGFAWLTDDPRPVNQRPNGMMQVDLQLAGIA